MLIAALLVALYFAAYAVLIHYYLYSWKRIPIPITPEQTPTTKVSILIPLRNESYRFSELLRSLQSQDYPRELLEVILINDHSQDDTLEKALRAQVSSPLKIQVINLQDHLDPNRLLLAYKKKALEVGIQQAEGTLIVTTDADCTASPGWIRTLVSNYETFHYKMMIAPVKITPRPGILSAFQSLDFLVLQGITGAALQARFHTLCNGANLAYEKAVFMEVGGFQGIDQTPSGDDMLLLYKVYNKYPDQIGYIKHPECIVVTQPETTWKALIQQRTRWASKADWYQDQRVLQVLLFVYGFNLLFVAGLGYSLVDTRVGIFVAAGLLVKTLIEWPFVAAVASFFRQSYLLKGFPVFQPLHIVYVLVVGALGKWGNFEWKGRKVKAAALKQRALLDR
ncbi:MAG: glycosyltransferase [Chitinophagaceae bacterium]